MALTNITRVQGLTFALGLNKQIAGTGLASQTISPSFATWRKLNMTVPYLIYHTEDDAAEIGKGNEFATQVYKTFVEPSAQTIEKYGSCEFTTWAWAYGLSNVATYTPGTAPNASYTIEPLDNTTSLEPYYFTVVSQLPAGGPLGAGNNGAIAQAQIGCGVEAVTTEVRYGPGRASVRTNVEYMGIGANTVPYTTAPPVVQAENYLLGARAVVTILGQTYANNGLASNASLLSVTMGWRNNLNGPLRFIPGSGFDSAGFQQGDRLLIGARVPTFNFSVFLDENSTELAALQNLTSGTATVDLTFGTGTTPPFCEWTYGKMMFRLVEVANEAGFVTVNVTGDPIYGTTLSSFLSFTSDCALQGIAQ